MSDFAPNVPSISRTLTTALCAVSLLSGSSALAVSCPFGPGDLPAKTRPGRLHGNQIPVDNIVVLMQENRSFDHYFGQIHLEGQRDANGEPKRASNPNPLGGSPITPYHETRYCEVADLDHSWNGTHREWDHGRMDGFTAANVDSNDPTGSRTMGFYDQTDLPFYYQLYATFAMSDRYFASTLTQTFPNRFFLLAGTSFGHIANDFPQDCQQPCDPAMEYSQRTIFNLLDEANPPITWKVYYSQIAFANEFAYVRSQSQNVVPVNDYFVDASNGTLPQVAFIDPIFIAQANIENDEHPPSNIQVGQMFVASVVKALAGSPQWSHSALFIAYDEHGGFYDHVRPPRACAPDDIAPLLQSGDAPGGFDRYGIRVPAVVVSPYARPHHVTHRHNDHTSILRFIETRFDLPALTKRDANANPMLEFFDFRTAAFATPPLFLFRDPIIDANQQSQCNSAPPPSP